MNGQHNIPEKKPYDHEGQKTRRKAKAKPGLTCIIEISSGGPKTWDQHMEA